jgi:hypothetical protein
MMKNIMKGINLVLIGCLLLVVTAFTVTALQSQVKKDEARLEKIERSFYEKGFYEGLLNYDVNLDVLDNVEEILHWEVIEDTLHIYTKKDSIRDERDRWEYIRSLDNDSLWE